MNDAHTWHDPHETRIMATILPFARAVPASATMPEPTPDRSPDDARDADWSDLMLRAQDGDRGAYHALLQGIAPHLRRITRRYLGGGEDAEDALQDILLIVHRVRHTYERGRPFKPWLNAIASRRCVDLLRRRAQRLKHEMEADVAEHPDAQRGPEQQLANEHAANVLHEAVARLPERQREAVRLLRLGELSLDEAAAQTAQSSGSLKVACHRALKSLRHVLAGGERRDE
jgi:RNA polymerase sigma-70 factor (ECF subfamily)